MCYLNATAQLTPWPVSLMIEVCRQLPNFRRKLSSPRDSMMCCLHEPVVFQFIPVLCNVGVIHPALQYLAHLCSSTSFPLIYPMQSCYVILCQNEVCLTGECVNL